MSPCTPLTWEVCERAPVDSRRVKVHAVDSASKYVHAVLTKEVDISTPLRMEGLRWRVLR